jgi:hypothetical protein
MKKSYAVGEDGYVSVSFGTPSARAPKRVNVVFAKRHKEKEDIIEQEDIAEQEDIIDPEIEIDTLPENTILSDTKIKSIPVEEDDATDDGHADSTPPMQLYGKLRCDLGAVAEEEDYDEGPPNDNLCYCITIPSKPSPTVSQLKHEFLKAMGREAPLKSVLVYHVSYQNGLKFGLGDVRYPDGRVGRFLDSDTKPLDYYNITNGNFFEIDIKVR